MNDVVSPHHVLHALVGGFPRHDKYRQALLDCPANEAFFGAEVENIIAIYPRRKDDDWRFQHVLRHRLILNELIQRRFLDGLARRGCDIDADLERVAVGMGELPAIEVREHVLKQAQRSEEHTSELQSLMRI